MIYKGYEYEIDVEEHFPDKYGHFEYTAVLGSLNEIGNNKQIERIFKPYIGKTREEVYSKMENRVKFWIDNKQ